MRHFLSRENSQQPRAFPRAHFSSGNDAPLRERDNGACEIFTHYIHCNGREFISKHDNNDITSMAVQVLQVVNLFSIHLRNCSTIVTIYGSTMLLPIFVFRLYATRA